MKDNIVQRHTKEGYITFDKMPDLFDTFGAHSTMVESQIDEPVEEKVDHPSHYNQGKYEVIDVITDWELDFCEGNVVKYVARSRHKNNQLEDLKKAKWYLDYLINSL
mgnify:CR=1 FL=1|jgi:hypothetical protein